MYLSSFPLPCPNAFLECFHSYLFTWISTLPKANGHFSVVLCFWAVFNMGNHFLLLETLSYFAIWDTISPWFPSCHLSLDPSFGALLPVPPSLLDQYMWSVSVTLFLHISLGDPSGPLAIYVIYTCLWLSTLTSALNFGLDYPTAILTSPFRCPRDLSNFAPTK